MTKIQKKISALVGITPLEYHKKISEELGANIYFKREDKRITGSFKAVPALYSILKAKQGGAKGMVAASGGNFGLGFSHWLGELKEPGVLFLQQDVDPSKLKRVQNEWTDVRLAKDYDEAEEQAIRFSKENDYKFLSPYNSEEAILANGTIGVEILAQLKAQYQAQPDFLLVALGGGGLAGGLSLALKSSVRSVIVRGVGVLQSPAMVTALRQNQIVKVVCKDTLAEPLSGNLEPGSITLAICKKYIDELDEVTESEIVGAMKYLAKHDIYVEPAGAVAFASILKQKDRFQGKNVVVILCGANIDKNRLRQILGQDPRG